MGEVRSWSPFCLCQASGCLEFVCMCFVVVCMTWGCFVLHWTGICRCGSYSYFSIVVCCRVLRSFFQVTCVTYCLHHHRY